MSFDISTSSTNFTAALGNASTSYLFNSQVAAAIKDAVPILLDIGVEFGLQNVFTSSPFKSSRSSLVTK